MVLGWGRGRQELRKELDVCVGGGQEEELGLVKNIFIINKQGCKGAGEAAEILTDRRTQASWIPAPALMASICLRKDILGLWWPSRSLSPQG